MVLLLIFTLLLKERKKMIFVLQNVKLFSSVPQLCVHHKNIAVQCPFSWFSFMWYFRPFFLLFRQVINEAGARLVFVKRRGAKFENTSLRSRNISLCWKIHLCGLDLHENHISPFSGFHLPRKGHHHAEWLVSTPVSGNLRFSNHPKYVLLLSFQIFCRITIDQKRSKTTWGAPTQRIIELLLVGYTGLEPYRTGLKHSK